MEGSKVLLVFYYSNGISFTSNDMTLHNRPAYGKSVQWETGCHGGDGDGDGDGEPEPSQQSQSHHTRQRHTATFLYLF